MTNILENRAKGVLVGAAVGDALGMPREFSVVPGPVSALVDGRLPAGHFTDDTEMMITLAESLVACGELNPADLAARFVDWYRRYPSDIGIATGRVLTAFAAGDDLQIVEARELAEHPNSAANGSLMRCFPVALSYHEDLDSCREASKAQSRVTHPQQDCQDACVAANVFIWWALHGAEKADALEQTRIAVEHNSRLHNILLYGIEPEIIPMGGGGAIVTLRAALWSVMNHDTYADAVLTVVNNCGDPDTVGCVTGALAGAVYGVEGIPQNWRDGLRGEWPIHASQIKGEFIEALALKLLTV